MRPYPIHSPFFWKAYVVQMRPYLLFVSGIAGLSGMAMSQSEATPISVLLMAFLPFFLGYGFGQALTDCFQTDTDKISSPYRPMSKGIISVNAVLMVSLSGLLLCASIFYMLHLISFLLSGLAVFGLATYSFIKRNITVAGPLYNAWIVALLPVIGYFSLAGHESRSFPWSYLPHVMVSFFSYASFVLIGYLKDIDADRATGYKTFPVVWGWLKTVILGDAFALVTICLFWLSVDYNPPEAIAGFAGSIVTLYGQTKGHMSKEQNEASALPSILATVRSFVLFHIAIVLHYCSVWWPYLILYYLLFELFLYLRPSRFQI